MTEEAKKARREYYREYRKKNRERINENYRKWTRENPEKAKAIQARYWQKKAVDTRGDES